MCHAKGEHAPVPTILAQESLATTWGIKCARAHIKPHLCPNISPAFHRTLLQQHPTTQHYNPHTPFTYPINHSTSNTNQYEKHPCTSPFLFPPLCPSPSPTIMFRSQPPRSSPWPPWSASLLHFHNISATMVLVTGNMKLCPNQNRSRQLSLSISVIMGLVIGDPK